MTEKIIQVCSEVEFCPYLTKIKNLFHININILMISSVSLIVLISVNMETI